MQKITSFQQFILEIQLILESHDQIGHAHFFCHAYSKNFDLLLVYVNLYQHAKTHAIFIH